MDVWMKCLNALDDFLDDIGDSFLALDFSISDQAPRLSLGCSICRYPPQTSIPKVTAQCVLNV